MQHNNNVQKNKPPQTFCFSRRGEIESPPSPFLSAAHLLSLCWLFIGSVDAPEAHDTTMDQSLQEKFQTLLQRYQDGEFEMTEQQKMRFYGLQRQAVDGDCTMQAPNKYTSSLFLTRKLYLLGKIFLRARSMRRGHHFAACPKLRP